MATVAAPALLAFDYRKPDGIVMRRELISWSESGHYLIGNDAITGKPKTFRKDRVVVYHDGAEASLAAPFLAPPEVPTKRKPSTATDAAQILFTGFAKGQRDAMEAKAKDNGLIVCQSVTRACLFVVAGPNAGPTKIAAARASSKYILNQAQFHEMLESGLVPDDREDDGLTDC